LLIVYFLNVKITSMVTKVDVSNKNLTEAINEAIAPLGGISAFIGPGDKVFLKPNFNTSDPFPASSDLALLQAVCQIVSLQKPSEIILGDSPTFFGNSKKYFEDTGAKNLESEFENLKVVFLNDEPWISKPIPKGRFLKKASIPAFIENIDKIIYLPCLKTHSWAQYTGALKLTVGLLKPIERLKLHSGHLQEKIAELNNLISPNLIIMDARSCFINKGPTHGEIKKPNLILASKSRVEIDIEGVKIIQSYPGNSLEGIAALELPQIKRAKALNIN